MARNDYNEYIPELSASREEDASARAITIALKAAIDANAKIAALHSLLQENRIVIDPAAYAASYAEAHRQEVAKQLDQLQGQSSVVAMLIAKELNKING